MVRNNKRRAFTIVELVIVIAVIAILAAVMIPTFTGIIKRANISADTQIAASMNTQLRMYTAEGNKIETEADLMNALKSDADFTAQLNPKSAKHGYHYWYNAEKQEIKLLSNAEVLNIEAQQVLEAGTDGAAATGFATAAPRLIVPGFYLLDQIDEDGVNEIAAFFAAIEGKTELGDDYLAALTALDAVKGDNETLADAIVARMRATVVISNSGVYYHADATNAYYYFVAGTTSVKANQHVFNGTNESGNLPTPVGNKIVLPSTVISVEKDALNFATANSVTVVTSYANADVLAAALAAGCSNAIFTTTDGNAYVVKNENELHVNGGEFKCYLKKRLPFSDFTIALSNDGGNLYKQVGDTVYVLITNAGDAQLYAQDPATGATSNEIDSWASNNSDIKIYSDGRIDFVAADINDTNSTAIFTATAINDKLETVVKTINVEIVKATGASIKIDGKDYVLDDGKTHQLTLTYDAATTYDVTLNGATYSVGYDMGTNNITIEPGNDSIVSVANNTLSLTPGKSDNTFTVSVDGCLKTTFYVNLIDASLAEFTHTFKKSSTVVRPFYVGTANLIKLSSLFKFKGADEDFAGAKITIYDRVENGNYYSVNEINNTENNLDATYTSVIEDITAWNNATIQFSFANRENEKRPATNDVYIEITGSNNYSIIVTVQLVEGATNVTGADFENLGTVSADVVLNGDATVTSGKKINLGANTLYGNGYIINATSYTSVKTNNKYPTNDYFISVNGGTIDNVYIDGPVYPTFEYISSTLGYHVSGIKSEGTSTVQNSYVAGFRQPIALNSGTLNVTNTTLYGGTYANLQVNGGILNLTDVTTVQPEDGIHSTMTAADGEYKDVLGLGIVVEYSAVKDSNTSAINVNGYLDQYNWISYTTDADLPVFTVTQVSGWSQTSADLDFKKILAALFNGVNIDLMSVKPIKRPLDFLKNYYYTVETDEGTEKYLNTGIIFMTLGSDAANIGSKAAIEAGSNNKLTVSDNRNGTNGGDGHTSYKKLEGTNLPLFSEYELASVEIFTKTVKVTAAGAMSLLEGLDILETGELGGYVGLEVLRALGSGVDVYIRMWGYKNTDNTTGFAPTTYTQGYYVGYGQ